MIFSREDDDDLREEDGEGRAASEAAVGDLQPPEVDDEDDLPERQIIEKEDQGINMN